VRGKRSEPGEFANFYALRGKKSADSLSLLLEDILRVRRRAGPSTLQRHNTENSKQIFPGKELRGFSPSFYIHVSLRDLYILPIGLPIPLQENRMGERGNI
jgi:hypothetical protein